MIVLPAIAGQTFAVLGMGKSGLAASKSLAASGATVWAWDDNEASRAAAIKENIPQTNLGEKDLKTCAALVMSPGIPHTYPAPHPVAAAAKTAGIPIIGDVELLLRACPAARTVAITGTNGKSTTTALIGHILTEAKLPVQTGGNLGMPALSLAPLGKDGVYVLELSSYQLELTTSRALTVGVLLNITPDHLDRHGGMAGYIAAKKRIINPAAHQTLVIGIDSEPTASIASDLTAHSHIKLRLISVERPLAEGLSVQNGMLMDGREPVLDLTSLPRLRGCHNWQNVAAAYAACLALAVSKTQIISGIKSFMGLAHRQQLVASIDGIAYINDSKATNADAASKALASYDSIYWILGGRPKEDGLNGLEPFMPKIRHAYLIGEAAPAFADWLQGKCPYTLCGTLDAALSAARRQAETDCAADATVLLSPACASFDQFKSFEHRGETFIQLVKQLERLS